jgi:hypothetical protein
MINEDFGKSALYFCGSTPIRGTRRSITSVLESVMNVLWLCQQVAVLVIRLLTQNSHDQYRDAKQTSKAVLDLTTRSFSSNVQRLLVDLLNEANIYVKEAHEFQKSQLLLEEKKVLLLKELKKFEKLEKLEKSKNVEFERNTKSYLKRLTRKRKQSERLENEMLKNETYTRKKFKRNKKIEKIDENDEKDEKKIEQESSRARKRAQDSARERKRAARKQQESARERKRAAREQQESSKRAARKQQESSKRAAREQ